MIHENEFVEQGARLVAARRHLWGVERQYGLKPWHDGLRVELRDARRLYIELLKERRDMVAQAQQRLF